MAMATKNVFQSKKIAVFTLLLVLCLIKMCRFEDLRKYKSPNPNKRAGITSTCTTVASGAEEHGAEERPGWNSREI